jgi:hypothetical protein
MASTLLSSNPWTRRAFFLFPKNKTQILTTHHCSNSPLSTTEMNNDASIVSLQEWQGWGTTSPIPAMVTQIAEDLKLLEKDSDSQMKFGRAGGKLQVGFLSFSLI